MLLLLFCLATLALAQSPRPKVHWNVTRIVPDDAYRYDSFTYNKDAKAALLLAGKINFASLPSVPFPAQNIIAINPDSGKVTWESVGEYKIAAWTNYEILTVFGQFSNNVQAIEPITKKVLWTTQYKGVGPTPDTTQMADLALSKSGARFAVVVNNGKSVACYATSDGSPLWTVTFPHKLNRVFACANDDFCAVGGLNVTYLNAFEGKIRWSLPGWTVASNADSVLIGDGQMFGSANFALVDAATGALKWENTLALGPHRYAVYTDIDNGVVYLTFITVGANTVHQGKRDAQNSYPYTIGGYRLSDGTQIYLTGPVGPTYGQLAFFQNGDFTLVGTWSLGVYEGATGQEGCSMPVNDYGINTRPGIDSFNNRFFTVSYSNGWKHQQLLSLTCV